MNLSVFIKLYKAWTIAFVVCVHTQKKSYAHVKEFNFHPWYKSDKATRTFITKLLVTLLLRRLRFPVFFYIIRWQTSWPPEFAEKAKRPLPTDNCYCRCVAFTLSTEEDTHKKDISFSYTSPQSSTPLSPSIFFYKGWKQNENRSRILSCLFVHS